MANDCEVGLGAFIVTESIPRSWRVTEALEVGMVGVNLGTSQCLRKPIRRCEGKRLWQRGWSAGDRRVFDREVYAYQRGHLANIRTT